VDKGVSAIRCPEGICNESTSTSIHAADNEGNVAYETHDLDAISSGFALVDDIQGRTLGTYGAC
jgi:hypothetical protein